MLGIHDPVFTGKMIRVLGLALKYTSKNLGTEKVEFLKLLMGRQVYHAVLSLCPNFYNKKFQKKEQRMMKEGPLSIRQSERTS